MQMTTSILCPILGLLYISCLLHLNTVSGVTAPPYGQLAVRGTKLISKSTGATVKLHGSSMYWSQWSPRFWVAETVKLLKCKCNANVVRAAMGTPARYGGYIGNPEWNYSLLKNIIEAALDQGVYVVVDWHTGEDLATDEISYAKEFFTKIAQTYGSKYPHILYEIWNEPNKYVTWEGVIKPYSKTIIDVIRQFDKNNVIIVGTPNWDTGVVDAAKSPLSNWGYTNIAYSLHFYAPYHSTWNRNETQTAYNMGLPMFVTEYGIYSANNNTWADLADLNTWYQLLDKLEISYTNWAVVDVWDQPGMQQSMVYPTGVGIDKICHWDNLSTYGKYICKKLWSQDNGVKCVW